MKENKIIKFITILMFGFFVFFTTQIEAVDLHLNSPQKKEVVTSYSWRPVSVNGGGYTNFVIIDANSPQVVYAGVNVGGIYKSYDYGEHWIPSNKGLNWPTDRLVAALTIDPKNGTMYLGVGGYGKGGIFKSTNNGKTWQLLTRKVRFNGLGVKQTRGKGLIVIDPSDSRIIYTGSYKDGLFMSLDGGKTWVEKGLKGKRISSILINPANPQVIYVASAKGRKQGEDFKGGIYKSTDRGNSWRKIGDKIVDAYQLVIDPADTNVIYAACGSQGIFKTTDGGNTWREKNKGLKGLILSKVRLSNINYISLAIDPKNTKVIYAGSGEHRGQIYKSVDGGDHWIKLTNKKNIYPNGWWVQEMNWPGGKGYSANSLSIDPKNSKRIYVSGRSGIWRSDDGGITWHAKVNGLGATCVQQIAVHPKNSDIFFVGVADWVMFRTIDRGKIFTRPLKGIGNWDIEESKDIWRKYRTGRGLVFAIDPRNTPGTIYLGTSGSRRNTGTIFKSTDGGDNWHEANKGLPVASVTALSINPTNYNILFAILRGHGLYETIDGGKTWNKINVKVGIENKKIFQWKNINLIIIHPKFPDTIYILDKKSGVYRTVNGGKNWEIISLNLPQEGIKGMDQFVGGIAVDYKNPEIVYVGLRNYGVYKSTDGGKNWTKVTPSYIRHGGAISIDSLDGSIYLASVPGVGDEDIKGFIPGIYKSSDSGKNWFPIHNDNLLNISLKVTFLTTDNGEIYLSTQCNGVIVGELKN